MAASTEKLKYAKSRTAARGKQSLLFALFLALWFFLFFRFKQIPAHKETIETHVPTGPRRSPTAPAATCDGGELVYVYELPPKFNFGLLSDCRHLNVYTDMCPHVAHRGLGQPVAPVLGPGPWHATHQFIGEMIFHARLERHPCRTADPAMARIFYVPFYGGLYASSKFREQDLRLRDKLAVELAEYLQGLPWWRRHGGRDHFLALGRTAWDFLRNSTKGPDFGANVLLDLPAVKNMSVLTVERQPWSGSNQFGVPYPSYFHPTMLDQMLTWQDSVRRSERPHLFSFVGGPRKGLEKAAVRDELIRQCAGSSKCQLMKCVGGDSRCHDPVTILRVMMSSRFCLQAPGDSFTRRSTFDSILAGCIPVFFSRHTAYTQYTWFLPGDPDEYSVFMDAENTGTLRNRIEDVLTKIPEERCKCSLSCPPNPKAQWNPSGARPLLSIGSIPKFPGRCISSIRSPGCRAATPDTAQHSSFANEDSMSLDNLHRFINLNLGKWNGALYQFDAKGNLLHKVDTKLSASSYGEDQLISLIQTLYIKQPPSSTSVLEVDDEPEWAEYKIKETNMFTVDKYQQIGLFPKEKAFSLRYQTAGMLETVLRQGILGEDDTGEESPRNLKLPSHRPSIVCENCLYSRERDMRARAFHIMDPRGVIEMLLVFLEERGDGASVSPSLNNSKEYDSRIIPFLGRWKGHSVTKRSGVYGATIAQAESVASLEMDDKGHLVQDIASTSNNGKVTTNVHWTGKMADNLVTFDGGYQMTLLPGGMYMGCPSDVAKSVAESKSFHLEFCWLEAPGKRQRLVRTYDVEGLAVSSTYFSETKR